MRDVAGVAMQEERDEPAPRTGYKPTMDADMARQVEPNVGGAEVGLQIPKSFRVPGWKIHGSSRHELQGKNTDRGEKRPGDIPGDAQHEITVAFPENPSAHGLGRFTFREAGCALKEQKVPVTGYAGIHA
jgi:hypothetical protein